MNNDPNFIYTGRNANRFANLSPEILFNIDLNNNFSFLENYITSNEFDRIKESLDVFNQKIFKNPALILTGFVLFKQGLSLNNLRRLFTSPEMSPILKEYQISQYDIIRYARFYELFLPHLKNVV